VTITECFIQPIFIYTLHIVMLNTDYLFLCSFTTLLHHHYIHFKISITYITMNFTNTALNLFTH